MNSGILPIAHKTFDYAKAILASHPTAYTKGLLDLMNAGRWMEVVQYEKPEPSTYACADTFRIDYMAFNLLRKFDSFDLPIDKRANAIQSFRDSEITCKAMNIAGAIKSVAHREFYLHDYSLENSLEAKIVFARELIVKLLGRFDWNRAHSRFGFSGGASTRLPRRTGHPFYKFQGVPDVTRNAALLGVCDIKHSDLWSQWFMERTNDPTKWVNVVQGSRADTVPKDSLTERFICLEPDLNMRMQRGIGSLIRSRLVSVGVNLNDQSWNQYLALLGSRTGSLATIDLKAASDSISMAIVKLLLPEDWYDAICLLRSEYTCLDGEWIKLEKVSSMGNGFTFELESLIFWALSKAVLSLHHISDTRLAIYGDDIVIHNSAAEPLELLLNYVGFTVNNGKSHVTGPFRESCGEHYFHGTRVTPFYIKEPVAGEHRYYWLLNSYAKWLKSAGLPFTKAYYTVFRDLKRVNKRPCFVPPGYGFEAGIEVTAEYSRSVFSLKRSAYLFRALVPVREIHDPNGRPALLAWLDSATTTPSERSMVIQKGDVVRKVLFRSTSQWPLAV